MRILKVQVQKLVDLMSFKSAGAINRIRRSGVSVGKMFSCWFIHTESEITFFCKAV